MDENIIETWKKFYETVGGRHICVNCGAILTPEQMLKVTPKHRRKWGKQANKKAPFARCLKKWWTGQDLNL